MLGKFKSGDLVKLKSGGPVMTVCSIGSGGVFTCHWFNQDGTVWTSMNSVFVEAQLEMAAPARASASIELAARTA